MKASLVQLHSAREELCALHMRIAESDDPKQMRLLMQREVISLKARVCKLKGTFMNNVAIGGGDGWTRKEVSHD